MVEMTQLIRRIVDVIGISGTTRRQGRARRRNKLQSATYHSLNETSRRRCRRVKVKAGERWSIRLQGDFADGVAGAHARQAER